jgi:hypothetical protein
MIKNLIYDIVLKLLNLLIFSANDDFAGAEPQFVGYLGIRLRDFYSKTCF